jgi:ParB family chromosome partitioning protein|nr:MAG TPA: chromosome partitioning protein [Caudoviricetes sp.]
MPQIVNIAIDRLFPHSDNPRKDLGDLSELAASIKASGVLQNLTVVPDEPDNPDTEYTIIIGHRRYAAAKIAGLTELPCIVVEMSEREQLQTMLVENMQRSDLTTYEQAQGFQMMLNMGDSVAEIAEKSGFSQTTIRRRVKLLDLDRQKFQKAESRGATLNDYLELDKLDSPEDKNKALDAIGTANFNSVLKSLISEQEIRKNSPNGRNVQMHSHTISKKLASSMGKKLTWPISQAITAGI